MDMITDEFVFARTGEPLETRLNPTVWGLRTGCS